jgi:hypothetical protein
MHQWLTLVLNFTIEVTKAIYHSVLQELPKYTPAAAAAAAADTVASRNSAMTVSCKCGSMDELLVETAARDAVCTTYP